MLKKMGLFLSSALLPALKLRCLACSTLNPFELKLPLCSSLSALSALSALSLQFHGVWSRKPINPSPRSPLLRRLFSLPHRIRSHALSILPSLSSSISVWFRRPARHHFFNLTLLLQLQHRPSLLLPRRQLSRPLLLHSGSSGKPFPCFFIVLQIEANCLTLPSLFCYSNRSHGSCGFSPLLVFLWLRKWSKQTTISSILWNRAMRDSYLILKQSTEWKLSSWVLLNGECAQSLPSLSSPSSFPSSNSETHHSCKPSKPELQRSSS